MVACADYPHDRGTLWDCPGCEEVCACTRDYGPCVHCARQRSKSSVITRDMTVCQICCEWKSKKELTPSDEQGRVWDVCRICTAEEWCECPYTEWVHYPHQVKEHDQTCLSNYESTPCGGCLNCCIRQYDYYQKVNEDNEPFMGDGYDPYQEHR